MLQVLTRGNILKMLFRRKNTLDIGAATRGQRRSSTRLSWCNVDVLQFGDVDAAETATEKQSTKEKLGISIQNLLSKFRRIETKVTNDAAGGFTLPPRTIAESAWMRGIPTDADASRKLKLPRTFQKSTNKVLPMI